VINPSNPSANQTDALPIEFLIRQESSLADWLNETSDHINSQIVAIGLKKGSFNCQYAPAGKDLHMGGSKELVYSDTWDEKSALPLEVSCHFVLYDPKKPDAGLSFNREILLAPVEGYHNEQ